MKGRAEPHRPESDTAFIISLHQHNNLRVISTIIVIIAIDLFPAIAQFFLSNSIEFSKISRFYNFFCPISK